MKHRIISDLHMEPRWTKNFVLPTTEDEKNTILIIAGDAAEGVGACSKIVQWSDRFHHVLYVLGNHEYYGNSVTTLVSRIRKELQGLTKNNNIYVLDKDSVEIEGILYLGCTMWTDFNKGNPVLMLNVESSLNDYSKIRRGTVEKPYKFKLCTDYVYHMHKNDLHWLTNALANNTHKRVFIIMHHAPCELSVSSKFRGEEVNGAYYSDLSELILSNPNIEAIAHGHLHSRSDYKLGGARIVCNARGYDTLDNTENTGFDPKFTIDL